MSTTTMDIKATAVAAVAEKKQKAKKAAVRKEVTATKKAANKKAALEAKREDMVLFTMRITPSLKADLDKYAKQRKITPAEMIRTAMLSYIVNARKLGRMKG